VVGDGEQAVDYLLHRSASARGDTAPRPDLVLLDLNLPKMSGHEVLRQARQSPDLRALPIVVITSSDAAHDIVTSYALGANCYVTKPGELDAFQAAVGAIGALWCRVAKLP
jgi:CheY-like chemotaxis protein